MTKGFLESIEEDVVRMLKKNGSLSEVQIACSIMAELDQVVQVLRELEDKGVVRMTVDDPNDPPMEGCNLQVWTIIA